MSAFSHQYLKPAIVLGTVLYYHLWVCELLEILQFICVTILPLDTNLDFSHFFLQFMYRIPLFYHFVMNKAKINESFIP